MKTARLSFLIALTALGLQACDVQVKPSQGTSTAQQQPAAPVDSTPAPVQPTGAPAAAPPVASADTTNAAPVTPGAAPATPGAAPETNAMGAQAEAAPASADGVATPTELARFFEQNAIKPKAP